MEQQQDARVSIKLTSWWGCPSCLGAWRLGVLASWCLGVVALWRLGAADRDYERTARFTRDGIFVLFCVVLICFVLLDLFCLCCFVLLDLLCLCCFVLVVSCRGVGASWSS